MSGTAKFINFTAYLEWYKSLSHDNANKLRESLDKHTHKSQYGGQVSDTYYPVSEMFRFNGIQSEENWIAHKSQIIEKLNQFYTFATEYGQTIRVIRWEDGIFAHLCYGNPAGGIIVPEPEKYLEYIPEKDYSNLTPQQVRVELGAAKTETQNSIAPADAENTLTAACSLFSNSNTSGFFAL